MPDRSLEDTREALFRLERQSDRMARQIARQGAVIAALRTLLSAGADAATGAGVFVEALRSVADVLRFDEALVMTGDGEAGLVCEMATRPERIGRVCAAGPSAQKALRGRAVITTLGHALTPFVGEATGGALPAESSVLCAPFTFMERPGFLMLIRAVDAPGFDRADIETASQIAILAAQAIGLKAAQRATDARSRFLSGISHELRTPLNGIIGLAAVMEASDLDGRQKRLAQAIGDSGKGLLRLVTDVLSFTEGAGEGQIAAEPVDLAALCAERTAAHRAAAEAKALTMTLALPETAPRMVRGDAARIGAVLDRLLDNAVRFTVSGGVTLRLAARAERERLIAYLRVEDTGPGIGPQDRTAIFEAFDQGRHDVGLRPEGMGLGLAVARLLLREMGSRLSLRSDPPGGAVFGFELSLPLLHGEATANGAVTQPHLGLQVAIIAPTGTDRAVVEDKVALLGGRTRCFEPVPRLADVIDTLHGPALILIDEAQLQRTRALWLMQASNPGILNKLPILVLCRDGRICDRLSGSLPHLLLSAPLPDLSVAIGQATRVMA